MNLPFVSRFAYDEMKAILEDRALAAEEQCQRLTDKLLRLGFGGDGEPEVTEIVPEQVEAAEEEDLLTMARNKNVRRPSALRRLAERENAKQFARQRAGAEAAMQEMQEAFDEGAEQAS